MGGLFLRFLIGLCLKIDEVNITCVGGVGREPESEGQDDAEAWKEEVARGREHVLALPDPLVKGGGCQNVTRLLWT